MRNCRAPAERASRPTATGMSQSTRWNAACDPAFLIVVPRQQNTSSTARCPRRASGRSKSTTTSVTFAPRVLPAGAAKGRRPRIVPCVYRASVASRSSSRPPTRPLAPRRAKVRSVIPSLRALEPGGGDLPYFFLLNLPEPRLREIVDELDVLRCLVLRQVRLAMGDELSGRDLGSGSRHDERAHLLAHARIGDPHDGDLQDRRVLADDVLHVLWIDVQPAADDEILLALDDEEVPVVVEVAHVAGVEPPVTERLGRRLRVLVIAG